MDELEIRRIEAQIIDWLVDDLYSDDECGRAYSAVYVKGVRHMARELIDELNKKGEANEKK